MDTLSVVGIFIGLVLFFLGEVFKGECGGWFSRLLAVGIFCAVVFSIGKTTVSGHPQYADIGTLERGVKYSTYKVPIPDDVYKYYVFIKEGENDVPVFYQFSSEVVIPEGSFLRKERTR